MDKAILKDNNEKNMVLVDGDMLIQIDHCLSMCPICKAGRGKASGAIWDHAPGCRFAAVLMLVHSQRRDINHIKVRKNGKQVNHVDGNVNNNSLENLDLADKA